MMKKTLLFALAALAMASCSKDETTQVNDGKAIGFRTSLGKSTRANVTNLENLSTFYVTALGNGSNYFTNMAVTSQDNGRTWQTSQTHYWPSYELEFFASNMRTNMNVTPEAQTIADFQPHVLSAPVGEAGYEAQHDLVVAYNTGNRAQNEGTGVALNFKHVLSQIEIHAKNSNPTKKVEVLGVRISRLGTTGTFKLDPKAETTAAMTIPQSAWTLTGTLKQNYLLRSAVLATPKTLTETAQSIMPNDDNFMIIPQKTDKWTGGTAADGTYISVLCRIYSVNGDEETLLYPEPTEANKKDGLYAFSAVPVAMDLQPGYKYTYTLEFFGGGGGAGEVDPDPSTQPEYPDIDPDPKPGSDGGDEIFGAPIRFTVTVDKWQDGGSQNLPEPANP